MIANHAHADGTGAYPSIETLARECRMSERQIKRIIPLLAQSGELRVEPDKGPRGAHLYTIAGMPRRDKMSPSGRDKMSPTPLQGDKMSPTPLQGDKMSPPLGDISAPLGDIAMSPEPLTVIKRTPPTPSRGLYAADFERAFQAYPKHEGMKEAHDVWVKRKPDVEIVLAAIERQKQGRKWRDGYVMGFARWLRGEHWNDEIETKAPDTNGYRTQAGERDADGKLKLAL
jgi:hypothetical protein